MGTIIYQEFESKYKDQVVDLVLSIQQKEFSVAITREDQPDLLEIEKYYQVGGNFWIAVEDGKVIGTIGLLALNKEILALRKMFVLPEYRGKGVSKKLLELAKEFAAENNFKEIYLGTIDIYKAAIRFYEKYDFKEIDRKDLPEIFPIVEVDNKFFRYTL